MLLIVYIALGIVLGLFIWYNLDTLLEIGWVLIKFVVALVAVLIAIFFIYQLVTSMFINNAAHTKDIQSSDLTVKVSFNEIPPQIQSFIKSEFNDEKVNFDISSADINLDGKPDYIIEVKDGKFCGTSGCASSILISNKSSQFDLAFNQNSQKIVIQNQVNGIRNIKFSHHKCACDCDSEKMTCLITKFWDGKKLNTISKELIN